MNEVLHANIFFFIASIATLVFCIFVCLILFHVYKITRSIRKIIERIEEGSENIAEDVASVRSFMRSGVGRLLGFFGGVPRSSSRKRKSTQADEEDDE
jgi:hypothetical protein